LTTLGVKPIQPYTPRYQYYWLYAAVEPTTGETFWFELPHLDTTGFQTFLQQFSQHYPNSLNLIITDNAPAHTAHHLQLPDNVLLWGLPPYSPELNPVERLWQDVKQRIDSFDQLVRNSLQGLRDHVADIINNYTNEQLRSITGYDYIVQAVNAL
jgi:transposase